MNKMYISRQDERVQLICERDPEMNKLITAAGDIEITLRSDYLASLVRSITGQQISVSAASAIYQRLTELLDRQMTAEALLEKSREELREAGLTNRKVDYVKDLAEKTAGGQLDLQNIASYDDETAIKQLTSVKGIGKWTAEMFLLLSLARQDILAVDDVGLQRAAMWLYRTEKAERRDILIEKEQLWKPYRSIVSFYLWEAVHLGFVSDYHSIEDVLEKNV